VDSDVPLYEFSIEDLYKDWTWSERFPSWQELRRYFQYVDQKLDLSKDVMLNTGVEGADFDKKSCRWNVKVILARLWVHRTNSILVKHRRSR
jgi:cation diffusion facilitator CzcD-associated flavoprotein CzcO